MDRRRGKFRNTSSAPKQFTVEEYLNKADEFLEQMNPDLAEKFYQRALNMEPDNLRAIDSYAQLLLELGDFDRAKEVS